MKTEELPTRRSYQTRFRQSVDLLVKAGTTRCDGLLGVDVVGAYLAAAVALARKILPDYDLATLRKRRQRARDSS